jgi:glutamate carboxypeptidase
MMAEAAAFTPEALASIPARDLLDVVRSRRAAWVSLLEDLVSLESPSDEPYTQIPVLDLLDERLRGLGFRVRRLKGRRSGGMLLARGGAAWRRTSSVQLLLGHSDTVWPIGTLARRPIRVQDGVLWGPGSFDMKAGLTHMILALEALQALGRVPAVEPVVFINSDEEIGSSDSTPHIVRLARVADRCFVPEPALGEDGKLKTARKGVGHFHLHAFGKSAHAGLAPEEGVSAIQELARQILDLHALNDANRGIQVNVGRVFGGTRANVVPAEAQAEVDVRVDSLDDGRALERRLLTLSPYHPGCTLRVTGGVERPPLERTPPNRALWHAARVLGGQMGLSLDEAGAGGGSDGNTTSLFTATLDGLGAVGDGAHAEHEQVHLERSLERCALLASLLLLPPGPQP